MTLTGHWKRASEKPDHIETREQLLGEEQKWINAENHHERAVCAYIRARGEVNISRVLAFKMIARLYLQEIRQTIQTRDILARVLPD